MEYREIIENFLTQERLNHLFEKWGQRTQNPFVKTVGDKNLEKYSLFCRSFESRLGNLLEKLAKSIVKQRFITLSEEEITDIQSKANAKADLCFLKDNVWIIIELKAGGNLDSKKEPAERANLDKLKLATAKKTKTPSQFYFATAYDTQPPPSFQSFSAQELLLGKEFWKFICEDDLSFRFILKTFRDKFQEFRETG